VKDFDPQIERIEPAEIPEHGIFRGIEAVMAHVLHHRANWAEGGCEPQQFRVFGDRIVVSVQVRVRLKHEPEWREGHVSDVFTFRNGTVIQFRTFWDEPQALAWAAESADAG
jgi:ketosteroid isomerase-like protein